MSGGNLPVCIIIPYENKPGGGGGCYKWLKSLFLADDCCVQMRGGYLSREAVIGGWVVGFSELVSTQQDTFYWEWFISPRFCVPLGTTAPPSCRCQECGMTGWRSGWLDSPPWLTSCSPCWECGWWRKWGAGSWLWAASSVRHNPDFIQRHANSFFFLNFISCFMWHFFIRHVFEFEPASRGFPDVGPAQSSCHLPHNRSVYGQLYLLKIPVSTFRNQSANSSPSSSVTHIGHLQLSYPIYDLNRTCEIGLQLLIMEQSYIQAED